ncbi:PEGA domain-containing protein [Persicimonas caeni]|uniref:PEGA domain-containing protein n=1 Tax=Persicimonas caeni TaxID=2292766 RepID=A0A4Y6PN12_PERCE|nr:PEGA domain-containing protein [Persicimonas caeni]QDG49696.1 PEGA domain-containing protein [Persicimonas caeni]QED30917.1 PEGA domain-containing protein [Persicimonas caeni]
MKGSTIRQRRITSLLTAMAVCFSVTAIVAPPSPFVGEATAQSKADIEQAKKRFRAGKKFYGEEKFLEAAQAFYEAYELSGRSELLYNVGRSYWKAKELKKAEKFLQQYLNELPDAPNADEVVESIIQIQEEMAAQMANVEVKASRAGVDIVVDKEPEPRCQTPCTVSLLPGEHTLTARLDGMKPITRTITIEAEQQSSVHFDLPGRLQISTDQRTGTVSVPGVGQFSLPLSQPIALPAGTHTVTVAGEDARWSGDIEVVGGDVTRILVPLGGIDGGAGDINLLRTASYGLVGASAGFLVGGIVLGMQASDAHAALDSQQKALGGVDPDLVERGQSAQSGANWMYALSAVSLASGAGLFAWDLYGGGSSQEEEIPPSKPSPSPKQDNEPGEGDDDLLGIGSN